MKNKYLEYIIIYLSVVIGCIAIAALVRIAAIGVGTDEFTANIVFWVVVGLGVLIYCILTLAIQGLLEKISKIVFPKSKKTIERLDINKSFSLDEIRFEKQKQIDQQKNQKLNIAILYTQKMFALYTSDADMNLLCKYIGMYSEGASFEKITIQPICTLTIKNCIMCTDEITFDKLPEAVAYLIKEITEIKEMVVCNQNQNPLPVKRIPIGIDDACRIISKAKPTVYALVRKRLLPCYKNGKKLYFFEDELLEWIEKGRKKTIHELTREFQGNVHNRCIVNARR